MSLQTVELNLLRDFPAPELPAKALSPGRWKNGLLVRMPNWLGDAMMALPALRQLKRILPEHCALGAVVPAGQRAFFHSLPWLDLVIPLPALHRRWDEDTRTKIQKSGFGAGILFNNSLRDAIEFRRCGISPLFGAAARGRGILLRRAFRFPKPSAGKLRNCHQANCYLMEAYALGAPKWDGTLPEIVIARDLSLAEQRIRDLCDHPKMLILGAGAAYGAAKRWGSEKFRCVAAEWIRRGGIAVTVGGPGERIIGDEIGQGLPQNKYFNMMGQTGLFDLMHLLKSARAAVANDSGVMHLASVLGTPGAAVFGSTDYTSTGPVGGNWKLVCSSEPCAPCFRRVCPKNDPVCMKAIPPEAVLEALEEMNLLEP